jgi:hypothetical protein
MSDPLLTTRLHLRNSDQDDQYAGGLVDGARQMA